ncbi:MAG: molybdopterin-dependent oxidoreductase [Acidobacteriia bacterium]|nr:molybdopterin-dependent oxidoreductase [Terriglobia bacterium]
MAGVAALQRVIRQTAWANPEGEIESFDLSLLDEQITPNDLFFIRSHFSPPASTDTWTISISGEVSRPYQVSVKDLPNFAQITVGATMECDENPVGGGLVSTAEWRGASLAALIEAAKPLPSAQFVRLWGADHNYAQSLPLLKATSADTLLAYRMNGDALPQAHGGPVRAIVPGWYGMYSVKWLSRLEMLAEDRDGNHLRQIRGGRTEPIRSMEVKSAFARPLDGAILSGWSFIVRGAAWAGEKSISKVELSTDGGRSWKAAQLLDRSQRYMWVRWQSAWKIASPGPHELVVQATDAEGNSQPAVRNPERLDGYERNECQRVRVQVIWAK